MPKIAADGHTNSNDGASAARITGNEEAFTIHYLAMRASCL
jgi:hypothetical protein